MAKATAVRNIRDDHQKAFLKIFNSLCGRFNRWQVWQDFVMVTAIEISNATDKKNAPERDQDRAAHIFLKPWRKINHGRDYEHCVQETASAP